MRAASALVGLGLLLALVTGCGGPDAAPATDPALAPTDTESLTTLLAGAGFDVVRFDDHSLAIKRQWLKVLIFVEDGGESLQAVFPHIGRQGVASPTSITDWNASRRFGRAYLDDDGRPTLASDLLLGDGVGSAAVVTWCTLLLDMAEAFAVEVWPVSAPLSEPVNE